MPGSRVDPSKFSFILKLKNESCRFFINDLNSAKFSAPCRKTFGKKTLVLQPDNVGCQEIWVPTINDESRDGRMFAEPNKVLLACLKSTRLEEGDRQGYSFTTGVLSNTCVLLLYLLKSAAYYAYVHTWVLDENVWTKMQYDVGL